MREPRTSSDPSRYRVHIFSIFAQWFSRGAIGVACFQNDPTKISVLLFIIGFTLASPTQGAISDKFNFRKPAILSAQCCLAVSCVLMCQGLFGLDGELPVILLAVCLALNGVFGNASPMLAAHMVDTGLDHEQAVKHMLSFKHIGAAASLPFVCFLLSGGLLSLFFLIAWACAFLMRP